MSNCPACYDDGNVSRDYREASVGFVPEIPVPHYLCRCGTCGHLWTSALSDLVLPTADTPPPPETAEEIEVDLDKLREAFERPPKVAALTVALRVVAYVVMILLALLGLAQVLRGRF